jgi:tetratricopeptide (TPR) repeat protein
MSLNLSLKRSLPPAALAIGLALAAACSQYQPFDSVGFLRQQYTKEMGPQLAAELTVPFELDDSVRAALDSKMRPAPSELRKINQVLDFIFQQLDLHYSLTPTHDAVGTFRTQQGNCLSFVNLFVGIARTKGLNPFYVEVTDYTSWNHRAGMVVSQGHIVAGMYLDGELKTYDFLPYRPKAYKKFNPIDDVTAAAHFYNNLGAEALLDGDLPKAKELLTLATRIQPGLDKALNNLGVVLARSGDWDGALAAYQKGLAIDPANGMILTNMARVFQQTGRAAEADGILAKVEETNSTNPFFYVYQGEVALSRGDDAKALDYMVKALRLDSEAPEVHVGFVKVYFAAGDVEKARHHLERALQLDATNPEALRLATMLGK